MIPDNTRTHALTSLVYLRLVYWPVGLSILNIHRIGIPRLDNTMGNKTGEHNSCAFYYARLGVI